LCWNYPKGQAFFLPLRLSGSKREKQPKETLKTRKGDTCPLSAPCWKEEDEICLDIVSFWSADREGLGRWLFIIIYEVAAHPYPEIPGVPTVIFKAPIRQVVCHKKFRKIRLERKHDYRKISGSNGTSENVVLFFSGQNIPKGNSCSISWLFSIALGVRKGRGREFWR